eukprot:scaffold1883_cov261-Pinguiococcus_pyrenoidosus.AAC.31
MICSLPPGDCIRKVEHGRGHSQRLADRLRHRFRRRDADLAHDGRKTDAQAGESNGLKPMKHRPRQGTVR